MTKEQYFKQRNELMNAAEKLIGEGKAEEAKAKMKDVEALDAKWDEEKVVQANLNALKNKTQAINLENQSISAEGAKQVGTVENVKPRNEAKLYESAWYKSITQNVTRQPLTSEEQNIFNAKNAVPQNAYTHDTDNTGILIPETVTPGIWKRAEESYPLYADARKYAVSGKLSIKKHTGIAAGDAKWYEEPTAVEDEQNNFGEFTLDGRELAKSVTVSWKLQSMAMDDFIPFLQRELGDRVGVSLGYAATLGLGPSATPAEPQGVETALNAQSGTPQIITYDPDNATTPVPLTYENLTKAVSLIHSAYTNGVVIYANNSTIWNVLANLVDGQGRPLFIPDVTSGGVGRIFGMVVKADASVPYGDILFGNAGQGLIFNVNEQLRLVTEQHAKERTTDFVTYGIFDGGVFDEKAFALIRNLPNA